MKSIAPMSFVATLIALAGAGCTSMPGAQPAMQMSASDQKMMGSCMGMSSEDMIKNSTCTEMMTKMKMSASDMQAMIACRKMDRAAMAKDEGCMSMMKMHPDMMKMPS
jgi:hypothetical protein